MACNGESNIYAPPIALITPLLQLWPAQMYIPDEIDAVD